MNELTARRIQMVPSEEGIQADIVLIEPNGEEYFVRCLIRPNGYTEIGEFGDGTHLDYLNQRYGEQEVWKVACDATVLGE